MLLETIVSALVPVAVEGVKQAASRWLGGVRATTIEEQIQLDQGEIEKIRALADLDRPIGEPSQWVIDLRASARYLGALGVISAGILSLYIPALDDTVKTVALEAANIAFGFLFGTRIVANMRK